MVWMNHRVRNLGVSVCSFHGILGAEVASTWTEEFVDMTDEDVERLATAESYKQVVVKGPQSSLLLMKLQLSC